MFELYTERSRRVIFFGRYEANLLDSNYLEPVHLLLALFREDKALCASFIGPFKELNSIRKQIENAAHRGERSSTSVDLPLSKSSKSVLAQAEKERERLGMANLDTMHLLF